MTKSEKWKEYVSREYLEVDEEFVEGLPRRSIDSSTFGLIAEATDFVLVEGEDGTVEIKVLSQALEDLSAGTKETPGSRGNFNVQEAIAILEDFGEAWKQKIQQREKWERTLEIAKKNDEIRSKEEFEATIRVKDEERSLWGRLLDLFR